MDPVGYAQVFEPHYDSLRNLPGSAVPGEQPAALGAGGLNGDRKFEWLEDSKGVSNFNSNSKYIYIYMYKQYKHIK